MLQQLPRSARGFAGITGGVGTGGNERQSCRPPTPGASSPSPQSMTAPADVKPFGNTRWSHPLPEPYLVSGSNFSSARSQTEPSRCSSPADARSTFAPIGCRSRKTRTCALDHRVAFELGASRRVPRHLGSCAAFHSQIRSQRGDADVGPNHWNANQACCTSYPQMAATLSADADDGSKRYPSHSPASRRASSMPMTRWPKHSTCASLLQIARSTEKLSCAVTAR